MSQYKLIFTGPVGAGKTTAIKVLSDIEPVTTESKASDETRLRKTHTTVAMDYGRINLPGGEVIHLYGTQGQERFDFMWDILTEGGLGLVLMIDNARPDPLADCRFFLGAFRRFIERTSVVVGITRCDLKAQPATYAYAEVFKELGFKPAPIFEVDAREKNDVSLLVEALLCSLGVDAG